MATRSLTRPRTFRGFRPDPPAEYLAKGLTNAGIRPDYEGVVFGDGTTVIRWLTTYRSTAVFTRYEYFRMIHGHPEYGTVIEFDDGNGPPE